MQRPAFWHVLAMGQSPSTSQAQGVPPPAERVKLQLPLPAQTGVKQALVPTEQSALLPQPPLHPLLTKAQVWSVLQRTRTQRPTPAGVGQSPSRLHDESAACVEATGNGAPQPIHSEANVSVRIERDQATMNAGAIVSWPAFHR